MQRLRWSLDRKGGVQQKPREKYENRASVPGSSPGYCLSVSDKQNGQGLPKSVVVTPCLKTFPPAVAIRLTTLKRRKLT